MDIMCKNYYYGFCSNHYIIECSFSMSSPTLKLHSYVVTNVSFVSSGLHLPFKFNFDITHFMIFTSLCVHGGDYNIYITN